MDSSLGVGHMNSKIILTLAIGIAVVGSLSGAEARSRWNPTGKCYPPLEGAATGKGILGLGSARAREAARDNWEASAEDRYGRAFANLNRAREVQWDCAKGAIVTAKCVVIARPCAARITG
jgi:hypothetical protein